MIRIRLACLAAAAAAMTLPAPTHGALPVPHAAEALCGALDADGDGRVSADEYLRGAQALFSALDVDRDDRLGSAELAAAQRRAAEAAHTDALTEVEQLHLVDHRGAGSLERAEHAERTRAAFEHLDADGDGSLSRDELLQALTSM